MCNHESQKLTPVLDFECIRKEKKTKYNMLTSFGD